jgi:ArsR family transcriptional regulator, virulence genes transcriptional regulator
VINEQGMQVFKLQAEICKTLSDPNRLIIIHALREGEKSVGELVSILGTPQGNVSRNLGILRNRGIVLSRREGNTIYYRLASLKIGEACDIVRGFLENSLARNQELLSSLREDSNSP